MNVLLAAIVIGLSVSLRPLLIDLLPAIELRPAAQLAEIHYGTIASNRRREVVALYEDATRTILLPDSWTGKTPAELSILVHELVHHFQNIAGLRYQCAASREKAAYAVQEAWLALFGQSLSSEFGLDRMTLKLTTRCIPN